MAAADYYNTAVPHTAPQHSPYHQSPYQRPHELQGSPVPHHPLPQAAQTSSQNAPPPPPYYPSQQDHKPSIHFAQNNPPPQQHRPSFSRPSFSSPAPPNHAQPSQPPSYQSAHSTHGSPYLHPQVAMQPPHMRPYMNGNQSQYALNAGYSSDPEPRRRRRHRHYERKEDEPSRDVRPRKNRSRSNNTDGFLGAAGGGLIGDLIFPGLGTVGGAVAGWIGGKEHGKHRKQKEEKLHREQVQWEDKFRSRSHSGERRHSHDHHGDYKHRDR